VETLAPFKEVIEEIKEGTDLDIERFYQIVNGG